MAGRRPETHGGQSAEYQSLSPTSGDIAADLISEPSTGTNLDIAATDQIRPIPTTTAIPIHARNCMWLDRGSHIFRDGNCEMRCQKCVGTIWAGCKFGGQTQQPRQERGARSVNETSTKLAPSDGDIDDMRR